jgi:hypothetical protein
LAGLLDYAGRHGFDGHLGLPPMPRIGHLVSPRRISSLSFSKLLENSLVTIAQSSKIEKKLPFGTTRNRNLLLGSNHSDSGFAGGAIPQILPPAFVWR